MRTIPLIESSSMVAWLESSPRDGQQPIRAELTKLPFTIGRNDTCDLQIESSKISREHVRIEQRGNGYLVRDLGSTNGTLLNGVKIQESPLCDGDLLAIANIGLTFHLPKGSSQANATQRFTEIGDEPASPSIVRKSERPLGQQLIEAARRLQEMSLSRAIRCRLQAVVDVQTSEPIGYEAIPVDQEESCWLRFDSRLPEEFDCRAVQRAGDMYCRVAVEQMWSCFGDVLMFISLCRSEVGDDQTLDMLERVRQRVGGEARIVVQLPYAMTDDPERLCEFGNQLRTSGVLVAIDGFSGSAAQLSSYRDFVPDYLKLLPSLVQGASRTPDVRRRLQELLPAASGMNCSLIACGVGNEEQWQMCKSVGIKLAQGDYAAAPLPLEGHTTTVRRTGGSGERQKS
jgi:EAL domain-containing protein (putative c-di-GMP-specific phosphodiesterase class I)